MCIHIVGVGWGLIHEHKRAASSLGLDRDRNRFIVLDTTRGSYECTHAMHQCRYLGEANVARLLYLVVVGQCDCNPADHTTCHLTSTVWRPTIIVQINHCINYSWPGTRPHRAGWPQHARAAATAPPERSGRWGLAHGYDWGTRNQLMTH